MSKRLERTASQAIFVGWDFSTSGVKCLAFDVDGNVLAVVRLPTDLWTTGGVSELNLMQIEGQARASTRAMAAQLRAIGRLGDWVAGGISATHHTSGRIDENRVQVRRAICWDDQTLATYHAKGLDRLGGQSGVREKIGAPYAARYSLSHLVKDEETLAESAWKRTWKILSHGSLAAGYLTGVFDAASVSSAASTGIMKLDTCQWCEGMLAAIDNPRLRTLAWSQLPPIVPFDRPLGPISRGLADEAGIAADARPLVFPTSDDQQAGLVGGGAVDAGQMAVVLGSSAVVNSSSSRLPSTDNLDVMRLNWGPYLWMRCYHNGAKFVNVQIQDDAPRTKDNEIDWAKLDALGRAARPRCEGTSVLPFLDAEPSLGVNKSGVVWTTHVPPLDVGLRFRAALEAIAYLIALGVEAHRVAGQQIQRITVSGGLARSNLMCDILASVLDFPLYRLESDEGPALGVAAVALATYESGRRNAGDPFTVADAVAQMVKLQREPVLPRPEWRAAYAEGLAEFRARVAGMA